MAGSLYIVATPIGNLEDVTERALRVLREVDVIACEDTRHTRALLNRFDIKTKTTSYHEHNERERAEELCRLVESGKDVAVVSDAGTPLISDPGFRIVTTAIERGVPVVPVPGPTAFVAALAASGLPSDQFFFAGFLPARALARRAMLAAWREMKATLIFYEAPHRIAATLKDALNVFGNRQAAIARELTKLHEEFVRGSLEDLTKQFSDGAAARGEMVLLISGANESRAGASSKLEDAPARLPARVAELEREGLDSKIALKKAAREFGLRRAEAYRLMVAQKKQPQR